MIDLRETIPIQHGGNQSAIRARLQLGNRPLLDFSAPLNALGPPPAAIEAARAAVATIDRYPEPGAPRLIEALCGRHGLGPEHLLVGAGTTELIALIGHVLRDSLGRRARELGDPEFPLAHLSEPTYGEYRRTSAQNGLRTKVWGDHILGWVQDDLPEGAEGIFWTGHPSNPTGRAWDRETLLGLADRNPGLLVIVDEAYLPFFPDERERTVVPDVVGRENLLVLRSMTKIYGFPGLRVGYVAGEPSLIERLRRGQPPWSVTTAAEHAAIAALEDDEYLERTIDYIAAESLRLTDRLWDVPGLRPTWPRRERPDWAPPLPNFVLASLIDTPWTSPRLQDLLAHRGLFVRECSNYRGLEPGGRVTGPGLDFPTNGHLRFCVRTPRENDRLIATLAEIMTHEGAA